MLNGIRNYSAKKKVKTNQTRLLCVKLIFHWNDYFYLNKYKEANSCQTQSLSPRSSNFVTSVTIYACFELLSVIVIFIGLDSNRKYMCLQQKKKRNVGLFFCCSNSLVISFIQNILGIKHKFDIKCLYCYCAVELQSNIKALGEKQFLFQ